jgi:hypothetical protein
MNNLQQLGLKNSNNKKKEMEMKNALYKQDNKTIRNEMECKNFKYRTDKLYSKHLNYV